MRITGVRLRPYRLGFARPWLSPRGRLGVRQGWTVALEADQRWIGLGDCAPLPSHGTETAEQAFAAVQEMTAGLIGKPPGLMVDALDDHFPAARAAVECALLDLLAQVDAMPLARRLANPVAEAVRAEAALGAIDETLHARAQAALVAEQRVLAVEMGILPVAEELQAIGSLIGILPSDARLRLNANAVWPEAEATGIIQALARFPVESLIDPMAEPSAAGLARLQRHAPFPLAADGTLHRLGAEAILAAPSIQRLVLRPMALGGAGRAVVLARRAQAAGVECVAAGSFDSAVGAWLAVHLAAAIDPEQRLAHGVANSNWLAQDVADPPRLIGGRVPLPALPGLGINAEDL